MLSGELDPPSLEHDLGVLHASELVHVQALVAHAAVERLREAVLPPQNGSLKVVENGRVMGITLLEALDRYNMEVACETVASTQIEPTWNPGRFTPVTQHEAPRFPPSRARMRAEA